MSVSPIVLLVLFATALVLPQIYCDKARQARQAKPLITDVAQDVVNLKAQISQLSASLNNKRCESGGPSDLFNPHGQPTGSSGRKDTKRITFSKPFNSVPMVIAGLSFLDIVKTANARVAVEVSNVDKTGFDVGVREWADSYTYSANIVWIACTN